MSNAKPMDVLKPYPEYRDPGLPWLEKIPAHWVTRRLDRLFMLRSESPQDDDQRITGYLNGRVTLRTNVAGQKIKGVIKEGGWQRIYPGDFAISGMNAHLGGMGISDSLGKCSPIYLVLKPHPTTNAHFIAYAVRYMAHSGLLKSLVNTIRFNSADFKRQDLKSFQVWLPSDTEQDAIVRFLDHANRQIDRYIRVKKRMIALLNEQKQAIIHQAVTRGLDPNVRLKPSGLTWIGDIPEHWEVRRLGQLITLQRGFDITKEQQIAGDIPVVSSGGVSSFHNQFTSSGPGVIVGRKGSVGTVHFINSSYWAHDTTLWVKEFNNNEPKFIFYLLKWLDLKRFDTGSSNPTLNRNIVHPEPVPYMSRNEQKSIAQFIDKNFQLIDKITASSQQEIALMHEYRTRLIVDVVTGQLDVREAAAHLPAVIEDARLDTDDEEIPADDALDSINQEKEYE